MKTTRAQTTNPAPVGQVTWTEERFISFARSHVMWRKGDEARVEAIGRECFARAQRGENSSLMHVCATMNNAPCWCAECRPSAGGGMSAPS